MTACGTKQTFRHVCSLSAFGGKADNILDRLAPEVEQDLNLQCQRPPNGIGASQRTVAALTAFFLSICQSNTLC
jgi:hypothetical protein